MTSSSTEKREIRKFGAIALIVFGIMFTVGLWRQRVLMTLFFGILAFLGLSFVCMPGPLRPVYQAWLKGSHQIGIWTTKMALIIAYFLVITPTALIKRLAGGRPIPLKFDPEAPSYWVPRSEPAQPKERFEKRY